MYFIEVYLISWTPQPYMSKRSLLLPWAAAERPHPKTLLFERIWVLFTRPFIWNSLWSFWGFNKRFYSHSLHLVLDHVFLLVPWIWSWLRVLNFSVCILEKLHIFKTIKSCLFFNSSSFSVFFVIFLLYKAEKQVSTFSSQFKISLAKSPSLLGKFSTFHITKDNSVSKFSAPSSNICLTFLPSSVALRNTMKLLLTVSSLILSSEAMV